MAHVHIIGGGISGLAAATLLAEHNVPLTLYEASPHAGGRCRSSMQQRKTVDHGLHMVGMHEPQIQRYLTRIASAESLLPVAPPRLPAASATDYLTLLLLLLRPRGKVTQAMSEENRLYDRWLSPVARAQLGTLPQHLSQRALRQQIMRSLRHARRPRLAMARESLQATFITPALDYLDDRGANVYFSHPLHRLEQHDGRLTTLHVGKKKIAVATDDRIILATPGDVTASLLPEIRVPNTTHRAITVHFHIAHREAENRLRFPTDAPVDVVRYQPQGISLSLRIADHAWHHDERWFAEFLWRWLGTQHAYLRDVPCPRHRGWREKYAGHAIAEAPAQPPEQSGVVLAGDWLDPSRPASLESAASSGHAAAARVMAQLPKRPTRRQ